MVTPMKVHGVDISHHQSGALDMAGAKRRGLQFIYHKATEGDSYRDNRYAERREQARKAGIPFGAYHFARPERGDAASEAKAFIAYAKPRPGDLSPCLDLETTEGLTLDQLRIWAATFCATVEKLVPGSRVVLYTPYDLGDVQKGRALWRPRYNNANQPPALKWDIWQFSNGQYGVPNQLAGFGHVDLNTLRKGFTVEAMLIKPKAEPKPERESSTVHIMEVSMQFSDTPKQMAADAEAIFARAEKRGVHAVMGTEAGAGADPLRAELRAAADRHGYRFWMDNRTDAWYAVQRAWIKGGWETWVGPVIIDGKAKKHTDKKATSVSFNTELGKVSLIAAHYLTKGRPSAVSPEYRQYVEDNRRLATAIGERAKELGKGTALVFYAGDQNIVDRTDDTFFGQPMTSAWDELGKWDNTGHGNIDVIASYDKDGRVEAKYARALDDKEFFLHTDHFAIEAGFTVKHLA